MKQSDKPFPGSVSKDKYSQDLKVEDAVCFCRGKKIYYGEVAYFTPNGVTCVDTKEPTVNKQTYSSKKGGWITKSTPNLISVQSKDCVVKL